MTYNVGADAYARYNDFDSYSYKCIKYLLDNNETIWKLLYYTTPDAWDKTDLTHDQKATLIYKGEDDESQFKVFLDTKQADAVYTESCIIRISPFTIYSENRTIGVITMMFEVYCNSHINTLSNYTTRVDSIIKIFIQTFNGLNGAELEMGIGKFYLDRLGDVSSRMTGRVQTEGQTPMVGKWLLLSSKSS